jgi:hypothetical protein
MKTTTQKTAKKCKNSYVFDKKRGSKTSTPVKNVRQISFFMQNKPNFKNIKIGVSPFETSKYQILSAWRGEKTNPIQTQLKPKQSQYKPNPRKAKNEHKYL